MSKNKHLENTKDMTVPQRLDYMSKLSPAEWDEICRGCGICCLNKYYMADGSLAYSSAACKNLDLDTRKCKCYAARLCNGSCNKVDLELVRSARVLPASCAYVEMLYGPAETPADVNWDDVVSEADISPTRASKRLIPNSHKWTRKGSK